jgi:hypothetical protein
MSQAGGLAALASQRSVKAEPATSPGTGTLSPHSLLHLDKVCRTDERAQLDMYHAATTRVTRANACRSGRRIAIHILLPRFGRPRRSENGREPHIVSPSLNITWLKRKYSFDQVHTSSCLAKNTYPCHYRILVNRKQPRPAGRRGECTPTGSARRIAAAAASC